MLTPFEESEPRLGKDPAFLYWYGIALKRLDRREDAEVKFRQAEARAVKVLQTTGDAHAKAESESVLESLRTRRN